MSHRYVLGISAFYHDSAAALLRDGVIVAAVSEDRFTRRKGDATVPHRAVEYCLGHAGIGVGDLTAVGFYDKPLLKFERILETYLGVVPAGFKSFLMAGPLWIRTSLHRPAAAQELGYTGLIYYCEHHGRTPPAPSRRRSTGRGATMTASAVGTARTRHRQRFEIRTSCTGPTRSCPRRSPATGFKVNSGE
jgi:carbamoyltransferase